MHHNNQTPEPRLFLEGHITGTHGPLLLAQMPLASLGSFVDIRLANQRSVKGVITAFSSQALTIAPLEEVHGVRIGSTIQTSSAVPQITIQLPLEGAIIDALGNSRITKQAISFDATTLNLPLKQRAPDPLTRKPITTILQTGVRAIDTLSPIGYGQRISLSAPAGTGKSTLLGMITRNAEVDHTVIGLIGERGREVNEFIEHSLAAAGKEKSTIIVSTSDEPPIKKILAAETALSISEHLRSQGKRVLLIIDSLTRLARAYRDLGLANGEIPVKQGFPASVLEHLPRLLERTGTDHHGSITAIFSLLQEESATQDYLTHEVASLLDGHLILDPNLAQQGYYPAIDVTRSLSRLTQRLLCHEKNSARVAIIKGVARLNRERDLLMLGGEADPELKHLLLNEEQIKMFLTQSVSEAFTLSDSFFKLHELERKISKKDNAVENQNNNPSLLPPVSRQVKGKRMANQQK